MNVLNSAAAIQYANYHPLIDPAEAADTIWTSELLSNYNDEVAPEYTKDEV